MLQRADAIGWSVHALRDRDETNSRVCSSVSKFLGKRRIYCILVRENQEQFQERVRLRKDRAYGPFNLFGRPPHDQKDGTDAISSGSPSRHEPIAFRNAEPAFQK